MAARLTTGRTAGAAKLAEQMFTVYYALGVKRSFDALRQVAPKYGLPRTARSTIADWSTKFRWQERIRQLDDETLRQGQAETVRKIVDMNEQQATIGGIGVQVAAFALERMLRQLRMAKECDKCGVAPLDLDAGDVARVMDTFAKWQRMGLGEVTDRREIAVTIWNVVIMEILQLFMQINVYTDEDARKREFAIGVDDIVARSLSVGVVADD